MNIRPILIHSLLMLSLLTGIGSTAQASDNTVLGNGAGASLGADAHDNTLIGANAGNAITTGLSNTLVGDQAGNNTTTGFDNAFLGWKAGFSTTTGSGNIYIGRSAGFRNQTGARNVFLGAAAGFDELGSYKLYIDNLGSGAPLIYGEFDNHLVGINGRLGVGTQIPLEKLHVRDGNLLISQTGAINARLRIYSNGKGWYITTNKDTGRLTFFSPGGGATTASFKFDRQAVENLLRVGVLGPNTVDINGNLMVTGTITPDYVFTPEYDLETIEDHAAYMWEHHHLPAVGAGEVNAQGQAMVNVGARSQGMLEELEKAHIYIEQLHGEMTALKTSNEAKLETAYSKIDRLQGQMGEKENHLETLQGEVAALKEKEAQLEGLKREMTALKALVNQLMVQDRAVAPGEEG